MSEASPITVVVDVDVAARKILKDPYGLSGVAATDLVALASYVLQSDQEPRLSPELTAAIAAVLKAYNGLGLIDELDDAIEALQTLFETEFPE